MQSPSPRPTEAPRVLRPPSPEPIPDVPYFSSAFNAFFFHPPPRPLGQTSLMREIREALEKTNTRRPNVASYEISRGRLGETEVEELYWTSDSVALAVGGVLLKHWTFKDELEAVQWACNGWLEQAGILSSSRNTAHYTSEIHAGPSRQPDPSERQTFGPFARAEQQRKKEVEQGSRVRATFVFLRSIGKIYLENGLEYTFSLPFIVQRAWPLHPFGVMIQRILEDTELHEAELLGDEALPTIFSLTSPLAEATVVGLAKEIRGGFHSTPVTLGPDDQDELLHTIPPKEEIVTVTQRTIHDDSDIVVTIDFERRRLTVWQYAYIKPKDLPFSPAPQTARKGRTSVQGGKRQSLGGTEWDAPPSLGDHPLETTSTTRTRPLPPLSALPNTAPSLTSSTTMASLAGASGPSLGTLPGAAHVRRDSLGRGDLSLGIDRMVLGGRVEAEASYGPREHTKMKATHWVTQLYSFDVGEDEADDLSHISVTTFDQRFDGKGERTLLAITLRLSKVLKIFSVFKTADKTLKVEPLVERTAVQAVPMRVTRDNVRDLLYISPAGELTVMTHGTHELPLVWERNRLRFSMPKSTGTGTSPMDVDSPSHAPSASEQLETIRRSKFITLANLAQCHIHVHDGKTMFRTWVDYRTKDLLTTQCLQVLALTLPEDWMFALHESFLRRWDKRDFSLLEGVEFQCFNSTVLEFFQLDTNTEEKKSSIAAPWERLSSTGSHFRFGDDPVFGDLQLPPKPRAVKHTPPLMRPHAHLTAILNALHTLGEDLRLMVHRHQDVLLLAKLICRIASVIRPEWVDYWKRFCPDATEGWVPMAVNPVYVDDRLPVWPPDMSAILYGRVSNPDWKLPWYDTNRLASQFKLSPSFAFGRVEPLAYLRQLTTIYRCLADKTVDDSRKRAENAVQLMVKAHIGPEFLDRLPLGLAAPLREVMRTCQLAPGQDWPTAAYEFIGRNDLAEGASDHTGATPQGGYRTVKDFLGLSKRKAMRAIVVEACGSAVNEISAGTGVELNLDDFTQIRFGQDKRLEEVARMLRSSTIPIVKVVERPELSEMDQAKEQQMHVSRILERTLALPMGRAMFTFGTVPVVTREAYAIPKMEYSIHIQPQNVTMTPDLQKISAESLNWGEFHNGVAAALRISPSASEIDSSWIKFNKPSELTPEHAGFLYGLGLTGHLREMVTWHTFGYLTPKHELTSIGVLLGLSAANMGSGNRHVTKLLAVHTPALLPTPSIDLNVPLITQAAGLVGIGLLFMGTKHRRMAEVCLKQISRSDLNQPDLSNEHREAYTMGAALAFGMVMLGKGTTPPIPADEALVDELRGLIHGEVSSQLRGKRARPTFDLNLTSPAATIALGLMYMKSNSQEMADILTIPDTVLTLNRIPPSFLLLRALARALIMWDDVSATQEWIKGQLPPAISQAVDKHFQHKEPIDDAVELAFYNIVSASCFVLALKYAGTAREEPYRLLISYYDLFTRLAYTNGPLYDHKIKRHAIRDGLNLISIALNMVMAGTGEINCLRRLRFSYGTYNQTIRYGSHVATHMSLGLLFLGGGRFTLGNSDAAVACMIAAFFPRFATVSSDNKAYLQALRHLWVLAIEPRCLVARDVDTKEIVYLPVKIKVRDGPELGVAQLISPTLIPDFDKLLSIRVDTPRYWPFYLDLANVPRHKEALLRNQTIYVKRRTAFLSYLEDPKGSRSLFVRSGSSTGDAATLDFPRLTDTKPHPASDLTQFISSFANEPTFLAFADYFCRDDGITEEEQLFHAYCHASLLDAILQDKPQTLQSHIVLYRYRTMDPRSRFFHLRLQDLRFAVDFYGKVFERRFAGRGDGGGRSPLVREATLSGALSAIDAQLESVRADPGFLRMLAYYARGALGKVEVSRERARELAWYLLRNNVPVSTLLVVLRELAQHAHTNSLRAPPPEGTTNTGALERGIRAVLHATGTQMTTTLGSGWAMRSLDEIVGTWKLTEAGSGV
ncbi:hypothetical protein OF83DRAFT_1133590 [Amylostereum chailletii]|nr:hypothetical protein OF83DRAFT_1133590 [Amylostereum chailletii]